MANDLSSDELTFLKRALPHFLAGKSVEEALSAVLEDDNRLFRNLTAKTYSASYGAAGGGGPLITPDVGSSTLAQHISREVYTELRAA